MSDQTQPNGGKDGGKDGKGSEDPIADAATIEELLKSSADRARKSFDGYIELGQKALRRLTDPESEKGSIADDVQVGIGLWAQNTMLAIDTWRRLIYLSTQQKQSEEEKS